MNLVFISYEIEIIGLRRTVTIKFFSVLICDFQISRKKGTTRTLYFLAILDVKTTIFLSGLYLILFVAGLRESMLRTSLPLLLALLLHVIQADDSVSLDLQLFLPVKEILIMEDNA
jgi:hypothetical protein